MRAGIVAAMFMAVTANSCESGGDGFGTGLAFVQNRVLAVKANRSEKMRHVQHMNSSVDDGNSTTNASNKSDSLTDQMGLTMNARGDGEAFISCLFANIATVVFCIGAFCVLRLRYPKMFANNVEGVCEEKRGFPLWPRTFNPPSYLGWIAPMWKLDLRTFIENSGLDAAYQYVYLGLCTEICCMIGLPILIFGGVANWRFGGHIAVSPLFFAGFSNVQTGSWLYLYNAFLVWPIVITVKRKVFEAMRQFMPVRFEWLRTMDDERANTILVESIPEAYRSDKALSDFFEDLLEGDQVSKAYVVKDTSVLTPMIAECDQAKIDLQMCKATWEKEDKDPNKKPMVGSKFSKVDAIQHYTDKIADLELKIKEERDRILREASKVGGVNLHTGFVEFRKASDASVALQLQLSSNLDEWILQPVPNALDVRWQDLTQDESAAHGRGALGVALTVGLLFAYMPCVIAITNVAQAIDAFDLGPLDSTWQGVAPSFGLTIMVSFLPTFLLMIFRSCYTLYADQWAQEKLQRWYFWFQVLFVVLTPAIGDSFMSFASKVAQEPFSVFGLLADKLPHSTHFFLSYVVLQWATHAMSLLRYVPLAKYKSFAQFLGEDVAINKAEPEDQDYYGMGGRMGRHAIIMTIGLVFGQMSPLVYVMCLVNFALAKLCYGYLLSVAETVKPDLGGVFFVNGLREMLAGTLIYTIAITGVFVKRGANLLPGIIAAPSIIYVIWAMASFQRTFAWERLSFSELRGKASVGQDVPFTLSKRDVPGEYCQKELQALS